MPLNWWSIRTLPSRHTCELPIRGDPAAAARPGQAIASVTSHERLAGVVSCGEYKTTTGNRVNAGIAPSVSMSALRRRAPAESRATASPQKRRSQTGVRTRGRLSRHVRQRLLHLSGAVVIFQRRL